MAPDGITLNDLVQRRRADHEREPTNRDEIGRRASQKT
jgi:hypothetical protein